MNKSRTLKAAKYVLAAMNLAFGAAAALSIIFVSYMIASIINDRYYRAYYSSSSTLTDLLLGRGLYFILIPLAIILAFSAISGLIVYRSHRKDMRQKKKKNNVRWEIAAKRILSDLNLPDASYKIAPPDDANEHSCTVTFTKASEDGYLSFEMQIDISGSVMETDGDKKICGVDLTYRTGQSFDENTYASAQSAIDRVMEALSLDSDMFYYPEVAKTEVDIPFSVISGVKGEEIVNNDNGVNTQFDYYGTYLTVSCEKTGT